MKLSKYIVDHYLSILLIFFSYAVILLLLLVFNINISLIFSITFIFFMMHILLFGINFIRKKRFYDELISNIELLDQKYLVLETISKPSFYEGEILYHNLYEIDRSMSENVQKNKKDIEDFKEYIEMWIHEVKLPISSLILLCHNHKEKLHKSFLEQVRRLDNYIDQVLYYVRSNYTEEDFVIRKVSLEKMVGNVLIKNKDDLLESKIDLEVDLGNIEVYSDMKWLEFILNQIINNSIKYRDEKRKSYIRIFAEIQKDQTILNIVDNGIGIQKGDLNYVCKKSFTGENGRRKTKSTGMGLYIVDKLCKKMGHILEISSVYHEGTEVKIIFGNNDFYHTER
ncbi:MAG: HAMP domain-containing histidine kinase [Bacilli bacterium]|nr:HAMP domain-containing histidine kinase [Bacilli bacterium]